MFQNKRDEFLNSGWTADDDPIPHYVKVNGAKLSLAIKPEGCWDITDKRHLIVCNLLMYS